MQRAHGNEGLQVISLITDLFLCFFSRMRQVKAMKKAAINMLHVRQMNTAVHVVCTAPYQTFAKHLMNFLLNNREYFSNYSYVVSNI